MKSRVFTPVKRIAAVLIAVLMLAVGATAVYSSGIKASAKSDAPDLNGTKVAYIPIDNRPVNLDRVRYLAASAGIYLLMPPEDTFRTALDNMEPNTNGTTYGDREALLAWLKSVDGECDYFVLSLDQLLSGGLVSSRWLSNTDLTLENSIADYIISLSEDNTVVLFDTVMRLASTVNYQGYQMEEYNRLRSYGSKPRKELSGDALTVENIIAGYKLDPSGNTVPAQLDTAKIDAYLASRARKLRLIDRILASALDNIDYCYIGVDDSSNGANIQTNEINYIRRRLGNKGVCFAATDELGLMGLTRVITHLYGGAELSVTYFGGAEDSYADAYDFETLRTNVNTHIASLGCTQLSADSDAELQVLIFTNGNHAEAAASLISHAKRYIAANKAVIIIDPTNGSGGKALENALLYSDIPLTVLLGYSNWNTAANSMGIALTNGISRYLYLKNSPRVTAASHEGFLKAASFAFLKDIGYKAFKFSIERPAASSFGSYAFITDRINSSDIITSLSPFVRSPHADVSCDNFRYPWDRAFEMTFDIHIENEGTLLPGDVDCSGALSIIDCIALRLHLLGINTLTGDGLVAADITGDGNVNITDYIAVRLKLLGLN